MKRFCDDDYWCGGQLGFVDFKKKERESSEDSWGLLNFDDHDHHADESQIQISVNVKGCFLSSRDVYEWIHQIPRRGKIIVISVPQI